MQYAWLSNDYYVIIQVIGLVATPPNYNVQTLIHGSELNINSVTYNRLLVLCTMLFIIIIIMISKKDTLSNTLGSLRIT